VLKEILDQHVEILFLDAPNNEDHQVIFKVDGGPGRLNIAMLAELRCKGMYLFPMYKIQPKLHRRLIRTMVPSNQRFILMFNMPKVIWQLSTMSSYFYKPSVTSFYQKTPFFVLSRLS
jgi:hypothetical protein